MLKKLIIEEIFAPSIRVGELNCNNPLTYKNEHVPNGKKFLLNVANTAINDFVVLVAILKAYGYWSENPRCIGEYQHQPEPYVGKPHISLKKKNRDVARICFVTGADYFGVSFFKEALISNCKHAINDSAAYQNVAYR